MPVEKPITVSKLIMFILGAVISVTLAMAGAWGMQVVDAQDKLRSRDTEIERKTDKVRMGYAVQQEQLRRIEMKLDKAIDKLDRLTER